MTEDARARLLREASILKMRAMRLRALGDKEDQWQAVLAFHEAAQKEVAALEALTSPSEDEEAGARIEACGLFLEAQDPVSTAEQWKLLPSAAFTSETGRAMQDRLKSVFHLRMAEFTKAWQAFKKTLRPPLSFEHAEETHLRGLVDKYPGVAALWWALSLRTNDATVVEASRTKVRLLSISPEQTAVERRWWDRIERVIEPRVPSVLHVHMDPERPGSTVILDVAGRIASAFSELLTQFVKDLFSVEIDLVPNGTSTGSFVLHVAAKNLPATAIEELAQRLASNAERVDPWRLSELLHILQKNRIKLVVSAEESGTPGATPVELVLGAARRMSLLEAAEAAATRTIDSIDVPQADDLDRIFHIVELVARHKDVSDDELHITPRQVAYYRRAAKILGLLTDSGGVTAAGRVIARLNTEDRLRTTVVHFESSTCGEAWIRWSKGRTLLDVDPETACNFLRANVPSLSPDTATRRARTLIAWHAKLINYHYARS